MGRNRFQNYGRAAKQPVTYTEMSGRYREQSLAERRILSDVTRKLEIGPEDRLLDIGCGTGLLLLPLSFVVDRAVGIDHPDVVEVVRTRARSDTLELIGANFLDVELEERAFTRIVAYSVVQYLASEAELHEFVSRAVRLLDSGGRMLIGDLPSVDKKRRFLASEAGAAFQREWERSGNATSDVDDSEMLPPDSTLEFTDEVVCRLLFHARSEGMEAYLLPQPPDLPFGRTREDLLISSVDSGM